MLHGFLHGFLHQKAYQQNESVKDPVYVDDALDEVVKYQETHQSGDLSREVTGLCHTRATHTNAVPDETSDASDATDEERKNWVVYAKKPLHKNQKGQPNATQERNQ